MIVAVNTPQGEAPLNAPEKHCLCARPFGILTLRSLSVAGGAHCGRRVKVTNTANGKSIVAQVADECPSCSYASLDMSLGAYDQVRQLQNQLSSSNWLILKNCSSELVLLVYCPLNGHGCRRADEISGSSFPSGSLAGIQLRMVMAMADELGRGISPLGSVQSYLYCASFVVMIYM